MKKKLFSIIMCILMVMCFMPTAAFAQDTGSDTTPAGTTDTQTGTTETPAVEEDCQHEAAIGDVHYDTLKAAVSAAGTSGGEITILKDLEQVPQISGYSGKTIIIDLNGKNISFAEDKYFYVSQYSFELKGQGKVSSAGVQNTPIMIKGGMSIKTKVTIGEDVVVEGWSPIDVQYLSGYGKNKYVTIEINGKLNAVDDSSSNKGAGVYVNGSIKDINDKNGINISLSSTSKITSTGAGIYAAGYANWELAGDINALDALSIKSGTFNITGGTYTSTGTFADPAVANSSGSEPTGAAISLTNNDSCAKKIDLTVTGGTFTSTNGYALYEGIAENNGTAAAAESYAILDIQGGTFNGNSEKGAVKISTAANKNVIAGGTFSSDPTAYVDTEKGFTASQDGGNWAISDAVAEVNGVKYGSFTAAIEKAEADATVKLLGNVAIANDAKVSTEGILSIDKNLTIDGNGKTITVAQTTDTSKEASAINVLSGAQVTIKDLTLDANKTAKHGINIFGGDVTLDNVTVKNFTGYGMVVQGKATATNLVTTDCGWGGVNVDVKSYDNNSEFTLNSGNVASVVVEHSVEATEYTSKAAIVNGTVGGACLYNGSEVVSELEGASLAITGGTFSNNPGNYLAEGYAVVGNADGTWAVKKAEKNADGTGVEVKKDDESGTTTVIEKTTEGTTTTETTKDGKVTTTVTIDPVKDRTTGTTTNKTTEVVVTKDAKTGAEVKTTTETTAVTKKTDTVASTETTVTTTKSNGATTSVVTKTVEDKGNNVEVTTKVSGSTANVTAQIAEDKNVTAKAVTVDATAASASQESVTTAKVTLPKTTVDALKNIIDSDATRKVESVELKTDVATLEIDQTALQTLTAGANGNKALVLTVAEKDASSEKAEEGETVTAKYVLTATLGGASVFKSDNSETNGTITVKVPYKLKDNESSVKVFYVPTNGDRVNMNATYKNGYVSWETNHFSVFNFVEEKGEITISATDTTESKASKIEARPGDEITVNVNLDKNSEGLKRMQVDLDYDKTVLTLEKVVYSTEVFADCLDPYIASEDEGASLENLSFKNNNQVTEKTGLLATLTFKVADNAQTGSYDIKISCDEKNVVVSGTTNATITAKNAQVVVSSYGDVDANGVIDLADVIQLEKHVAKWTKYQKLANSEAGDLDGDGKLTLTDVEILTLHLAEWEGYETLPLNS